ncbi:MAG: tRNA 2-selenouridine(34) synthase MnmH [Bdellovibrionota bacterium]
MSKLFPSSEIKSIFEQNLSLIDVRAPVEFAQGHLPNAINLPILNDEERAQVGTLYKQQGNEAAVKLGHQLISGSIKELRVNAWLEFIRANPKTLIYCFRGGQRSGITQDWISEAGFDLPRLEGGYKAARRYLLKLIEDFSTREFLLISGLTGSGKTRLLLEAKEFCPVLDLENLANHRGSAFGGTDTEQPSQANFENNLAVAILNLQKVVPSHRILLEDESHTIGRCIVPLSLYKAMQNSEAIWMDEPLESRVENIYEEYILNSHIGIATKSGKPADKLNATELFARYKSSLQKISRKLGGDRTTELMSQIDLSVKAFHESNSLVENKVWIEKLLTYYYDPLYLNNFKRRNIKVRLSLSRIDCLHYLKSL